MELEDGRNIAESAKFLGSGGHISPETFEKLFFIELHFLLYFTHNNGVLELFPL